MIRHTRRQRRGSRVRPNREGARVPAGTSPGGCATPTDSRCQSPDDGPSAGVAQTSVLCYTDGGRTLVDDREDTLADHCANPEAFDKLGDPEFGRLDPGRCHVCLAWVRYPYTERTLPVCPTCRDRTDAERGTVRNRVREAPADVWKEGL